ncbi:helix-turn-helix domain-containing protein [Sphingobacterium siyangense]|uniref:helix-turn-helix domain-containing protein n=1 Tax=Sphingobacterium siyangense TaxID=459529 RepID=UPI001F06E802|nr:helix-turn-helix transcriptional regulator [Sphingobacterium siyangense]
MNDYTKIRKTTILFQIWYNKIFILDVYLFMAEQYIDKENLEIIRERLWAISNKKKITLEDIQDRTGFSYSQVHRIVRGSNNMSVSGLIAVCKALEVQPREVFDFEIKIPKHLPLRRDRKA